MKILQVCHKPPYPPIEGGSIAMHNLAMGLIENNCELNILAMNTYKQHCDIRTVPEEFKFKTKYQLVEVDIRLKAFNAFVNLFSKQSYNISRFKNDDFEKKLKEVLSENAFALVILESLFTTPYIEVIRQFHKGTILLRSHNVEHHIWQNISNHEKNLFRKIYLKLLAKRLKRYELKTISEVDLIASISESDIAAFKTKGCETSMIHLPFGINFNEEWYKSYVPPEETPILFHIGSMEWIPHQEAFKWFLEKVWPSFNQLHPQIELHLAGSNMPKWMLNGQYPSVKITDGGVNGKTYMLGKSIMLVPSLSGSGIRIKIAEGMAMGKVILTTTNGMMGIPGKNGIHAFISDSEEEWVMILSNLVKNPDLVNQISINARQFAEKEFDYKSVAKKLVF